MRISFEDRVVECIEAVYKEGSIYLEITTIKGYVYHIDCRSHSVARKLAEEMLVKGWVDLSKYRVTLSEVRGYKIVRS